MKEYPIVLIHGYPFDHTMWYGVIAALGAGTRVYAPDLRGFGNNELPDSPGKPSLDLMADDIADLLAANNCERAIIAGMSMGGYVALAFAERHRKNVAGLALISTQAAEDSEEARNNRRAMIEKIKREGPRVAADALLPKMFTEANAKNEDYRAFAIDGAERAGVKGLTWALEAMARRPDRTELLAQLDVPISVIHGTEDKIIPIEKAKPMAQICRQECLVPVRGAGHATPIEAPDAVAQALARLVRVVQEADKSNETASQESKSV